MLASCSVQRIGLDRGREVRGCLHQQTGFSASTVSDDDEFAADLSHVVAGKGKEQASV